MIRYELKIPHPKKVKPGEEEKPAKDHALIMAVYHFNGKRMRLSTGEYIRPKDWNKTTRRPRATAPNFDTLTVYLDRLEAKIKEVHLAIKSEFKPITPEALKEAVKNEIGMDGGKETFIKWIERYAKEKGHSVADRKIFITTKNLIENYPGAKDFHDINGKWFERFQSYMEAKRDKRTPKGCSVNYINRTVRYIRELLTIARKEGVTKADGWIDADYSAPFEEADTIYLSVDELMKIHSAELPDYLRHTADRFLIGAFTGLRFSDFSTLDIRSAQDGAIRNRNRKTGELVVIPIHPVVAEILARYPDGLPRAATNQVTNRFLKEIGKRAKIETPVTKRQTSGGVRRETTLPKYEFITTHTARRSAATNMYLAGVPAISIMKITGHRTEKSFLKYLKVSQEENAKLIADHPYFKAVLPTS